MGPASPWLDKVARWFRISVTVEYLHPARHDDPRACCWASGSAKDVAWQHVAELCHLADGQVQLLRRQLEDIQPLQVAHFLRERKLLLQDGWKRLQQDLLLCLDLPPGKDVVQIGLDLVLQRLVRSDGPQMHPHSSDLLGEYPLALGELEECLRDLRHGDGERRQRKEHEDQHEDALWQIHRLNLRRHGSHNAEGPVEAEDVGLSSVLLQPSPLLRLHRPVLPQHRGPVRPGLVCRLSLVGQHLG
mmetsp:Transcript_9661/g.30171  ORF Transcript_9661/g.30171 Transcript_9661/m.30171 type:complete len:245 (-) Transcript_9661:578-1312(-)